MEESLTLVLDYIARFEYLRAKKEHEALLNLMNIDKVVGERFRLNQMKPHEKLIKTMLHKCEEIDLAFEGNP
jgi:hypothetical protein